MIPASLPSISPTAPTNKPITAEPSREPTISSEPTIVPSTEPPTTLPSTEPPFVFVPTSSQTFECLGESLALLGTASQIGDHVDSTVFDSNSVHSPRDKER